MFLFSCLELTCSEHETLLWWKQTELYFTEGITNASCPTKSGLSPITSCLSQGRDCDWSNFWNTNSGRIEIWANSEIVKANTSPSTQAVTSPGSWQFSSFQVSEFWRLPKDEVHNPPAQKRKWISFSDIIMKPQALKMLLPLLIPHSVTPSCLRYLDCSVCLHKSEEAWESS